MNVVLNSLNAKLNPICHLLALLGPHPILHVSMVRVKVRLNWQAVTSASVWMVTYCTWRSVNNLLPSACNKAVGHTILTSRELMWY